ncbi:MAG: chromosomal replication initiator protein DnaA [Deltaproteobacteria bacterium]|nr:chromosomal replication initiator protein DnaA [Deltaproteobacteria bacterium]
MDKCPPLLWEDLKSKLKSKIGPIRFAGCFQAGVSGRLQEDTLIITVPNKFILEWITDHYIELVKSEVAAMINRPVQIGFEVLENEAEFTSNSNDNAEQEESNGFEKSPTRAKEVSKTLLNPKYTFDRFVVGSGNNLAHAACRSIAKLPGGHYNPLFLYGGVGLGKTHLLHAVGLEILKIQPNFRIVYVSAEKFMNEFIESVRNDKMISFRKKYRESCDMLLVDDVQFLGGKEQTQHEFFHTFNIHYDSQRQIILTSDKIPKEIPGLEERLRSRFEWGLIADVQAPDLETRVAILKKKAEQDKIRLSDEVAMYLAREVKSNVRELEGALIRLNAFCSLAESPIITIDLAKEVFKNHFEKSEKEKKRTTADSILLSVAQYYQIALNDIKSARRMREFSYPRQIAMFLCKKHLHLSYPEIGQKFGGKDHTTVMHACRKIERLMEQDTNLQNDLSILEKTIV